MNNSALYASETSRSIQSDDPFKNNLDGVIEAFDKLGDQLTYLKDSYFDCISCAAREQRLDLVRKYGNKVEEIENVIDQLNDIENVIDQQECSD